MGDGNDRDDRLEVHHGDPHPVLRCHAPYGVKDVSISDSEPCLFSPLDVRASADGAALFISEAGSPSNQCVYFANTNTKEAHTSKDLNGAHSLTWAYDDLVIGMTKQGVVAFTPASA